MHSRCSACFWMSTSEQFRGGAGTAFYLVIWPGAFVEDFVLEGKSFNDLVFLRLSAYVSD